MLLGSDGGRNRRLGRRNRLPHIAAANRSHIHMQRITTFALAAFAAVLAVSLAASQQPAQPTPQQPPAGRGGRGGQPPIQPKPEELQQVQAKTAEIEAIIRELKSKHTDPDLVARCRGLRKGRPDAARISRSVYQPERNQSFARGIGHRHRARPNNCKADNRRGPRERNRLTPITPRWMARCSLTA